MNNIQHLYKALIENNLLNISFDKFSQFYENDKYKQNVFSAIKEKGLFDGDFEKFSSMYSLPKAKPGVDADGNDIMIGGQVSQEKNTWIENAFGKNTVTDFVGDLYRSGKQGWAAGQSVDEALEVYKKGRNLSAEDLQAFLDANKRMQEAGVTDEMLNYQKMYEENGGGMWGAVKAFAANPTIAPSVIVSSIAQMISSAEDSEEVLGMAALSSGAGAAAGAAIGSTGFSLGPLGVLTTGGGAISGAVGGFFGGLTGVMETGNTLAQLLQEEIGEGVEMTKENVRAILEDADKFQDLKDKAVARGLTIGAIEGITAGISRGIGAVAVKGAATVSKSGKTVQKALTATQKSRLAKQVAALEMGAGAGGEALGQKAAGQELDASEIFLEGIAEAKGVANVADILAKKSYMLNGGAATRKDIESFLNNENISNEDKAKANIEVIGDKSLKAFVDQAQGKAIADSQIDSKITDKADREALVELEQKRVDLNKKAEKKGIEKVPNAAEQLAIVEAEIEAIIGKYEGAVEIGKSEGAQKVRRARLDILKDEITGKVKKMKAYKDMDIDTFEGSIDEIVEQYTNNLVENANYDIQVLEAELKGYQEKGDAKSVKKVQEMIADRQSILEDAAKGLTQDEKGKKIKISEAVNAGTYGMLLEDNATGKLKMVLNNEADITDEKGYINVAAHEFLHAALRKTFFKKSDVVAGMTEAKGAGIQTGQKLINHLLESGEVEFLNEIKSRLQAYGAVDKDGKINLTEDLQAQEVLNLLSDSMVNEIYKAESEGFFVKLGNIISEQVQKLLPASYAKKVQFRDGKQVFDFVKTFGKAVAGDKAAGKVIARAAKEGIDVGPVKGKEGARVTAQKSSVIQEKVDGFALNEDGSKMTKQEYDDKGSVDAYMYLIGEQNIDPLINKQLVKAGIDINATDANVNGVPLEEFLERVRELLIPDILGFDPSRETTKDGKFGLSGHINSRIAFRVGDAAKKAKKEVAAGSLDKDVSGDGKMTAADFIADEQDAMVEDFENQDQSIFGEPAEKRGVVKSEYRQKLKRKNGEKFIAEQQEEDIRQGVRDIVKSQNTEISEKDFMLKFENNVKKKMKNIVQQAMGSGQSFIDFVYDNIDVILEYSTIQDLVAMERLVGQKFPEGKRIFSVIVKKNLSPTEVDKAIQQGKIKPDVGRTTGPDLYEKRKPTKAEVEAFFLGKTSDGQTMAEVLNYEIGRSTRGTRKDGLSRMMISTLALDAVMETVQEPAVLQDAMIFSPNIDIEVQLQDLARKVNRGINTQFSLSSTQETQALELVKMFRVDGMQSANVKTFVQGITKDKDLIVGHAIREYLKRRQENYTKVFKLPNVAEEYAKLKNKRGNKNKPAHKILEILVINNLIEVTKGNKDIKALMKKPREGGLPDMWLEFPGGVKIGFEVKGDSARGVSNSYQWDLLNDSALKTPQEVFNPDAVKELYDKAKPILKEMATLLGLKEFNSKTTVTKAQWEVIKNAGLAAKLSKTFKIVSGEWVSFAYLNKSIPSQYINMGSAGLFHLGDTDVLNLKTKGINDAVIPLTIRMSRSKSGKLILRVEPQLNAAAFKKAKLNLFVKQDAKQMAATANVRAQLSKGRAKNQTTVDKAYNKARLINANTKAKGISIFDFDETVGVSENFVIATKGKQTKRIASDEWPFVGDVLASEGWSFDFTDFNRVTKGKPGPLMQKLKNQIKKYGAKDVYILTARAPESQKAIHDWLKTQGVNLPYENITGLGNSTGEAKAMWILDKYANEGYNDIYFVDDAIPNVEAVKIVLDQLDIKSKSVQARVQFSKGLGKKFNGIIEQNKGVDADKVFSDVSAKKFGKRNNPFRFFVPPSADDFVGLLRYFVGKGKVGEAQMQFFKEALIDPFARAYKEMNSAKMAILNDYKELLKQFPDVKKKLGKLIPGSEFTYDNAVRVYLFNKAGHDIPGLSDKEVAELSEVVTSDPELLAFAETLSAISRVEEGYAKPSDTWSVENVAMDMQNAVDKIGRAKYLEEWQANVDEMFDKDNMNKIEAVYGNDVREALEDMLYAMKTGRSRPQGSNKIANAFMNWINNSVGAIMFFNARSAILQLISIVNFTNFEENNIFAQAKMFANQKQFWSDFSFIFNSDYLKARRSGLKMNINEAELQNAVAGATNKALAALRYILSLGFTPTQIADSVAIAFGGANFYRSKLKKYLAEGMSQKEAQEKAFLDFQEIAEESQQSARPDKISQQQRSVIGRIILNFANTPMQMARLTKKAAQDLIAGRGNWKANVSRILYYGFVQNLIFSALQQAIFAIGFDEEEDDEKKKEKQDTKVERIFNGALDSLLRGSGIYGAVIATVKNTAYKFMEERDKGFRGDLGNVIVEAINLSPSIGSKFRKLYSAMKTDKFNKHVYDRMGYDTLENPIYQAITLGVEGTTNIPINRMLRKIDNLKASTDSELHALQRIFVFLGWDQWSLGIDSREEVDKVKEEIKQEKKDAKKEEVKKDKKQKKEKAEKQYELDQKKERKDGKKNITCSGAKSDGTRCTRKPIKNGKCTIHEKVEMIDDKYKDRQCKRIKSDGSRCKMMTRSKSQFCYYHD